MEMSQPSPVLTTPQPSVQTHPYFGPHLRSDSGSGSGSGSGQASAFVPAKALAAGSDRMAQDRISVRLTKDRRDALAIIAGDDHREIQPIEVIDRALALASRLIRAHSTHASATAPLSDALKSPWQPTGSHIDLMADTLSATVCRVNMQIERLSAAVERMEMVLLRLGAVETAARSPLSTGATLADVAQPMPTDEIASSKAETQSETPPQTLYDWLNDQLASQQATTAKSAVLLGRRNSIKVGGEKTPLTIECELVAIDGTRLLHDSQMIPSAVAALPDDLLAEVRHALLSNSTQDWCLWCERVADAAWTVHLHPFAADGGVQAPISSFQMGLNAGAKRPPLADSMSAN